MSNYFKQIAGVIIIFVVSLYSNKVRAQSPGMGKVEIYAPNTYAFAKYGDVPVEPSTGIPNINIPLLTFTDMDINLDISLSYYASGIKVDQEATWVGLGWSLNAGGVITRQTVGIPDCYNYAGVFNRTNFPDYDGSITQAAYADQIHDDLQQGANNASDNGHDIFYFNFNGRSGKFYLNDQGNGVFVKYEDFKVALVHNPSNYERPHFTITDERGFIYEFKDFETTLPSGSSSSYISAWYLSKITSPSGGQINFEYKLGGLIHRHYQKRGYDEAWFAVDAAINNIPGQYIIPSFDYIGHIDGLVLKKITSSSGNYVEFITSPHARQDSENLTSNQLDSLVVYNYKAELTRRFKFSYSYFEANNNHKLSLQNNAGNFLNYRLRLDSLQEVSTNGQLQSPYHFEYYGDNNPVTDDPYTLPYRLSPCQDHWGYYNNSNNQTIFPANPADKPFHIDEWYMEFSTGAFGVPNGFTYSIPNGGNREPDSAAAKAGCLNKIVYPTSGYKNFQFESHDLDGNGLLPIFGGVRIKTIESGSGYGPAKIVNYEYQHFESNDKCTGNSNPYYTWYYHGYNPATGNPGNPELLAAWGVPISISSYNALIVHVDGTPQIALGTGTNAVYTDVIERSPGNGYSFYHYNFDTDIENWVGWDIDGVPVPGIFMSAFVTTNGLPPYDPAGAQEMFVSSCTFPFPNFISNDWRRGHLVAKEVWTEDHKKISEDSIYYDIKALDAAANYKVIRQNDAHYFYARSYIVGGMVRPVKEVQRIYQADGTYLSTVKEFEYNSTAHKQLTKSQEYSSEGDLVKTEYYYPTEYGSTFASLKNKNILLPIDTRTYRGSRLIAGTQIEYNDIGQPSRIRKAEYTSTDIPFNNQNPYTFTEESAISYNNDHLVESVKDRSGISKNYLWGYNQVYPIAEVINAQVNDVFHTSFEDTDGNSTAGDSKTGKKSKTDGFSKSLSGLTNGNYTLSYWQKSGSVWNLNTSIIAVSNGTYSIVLMGQVDEVRFYPTSAQMTTYTYDPLIGMTSQCDSRNIITYYDYDAFGRLKVIRDQDRNILKAFDYKYQQQQ